MSALIFLRLICPAFISPIDWGALSTKSRGACCRMLQLRVGTETTLRICSICWRVTADIMSVRKEADGSPEPHHRSLSFDMSMFMQATPVLQAAATSEQDRAGATEDRKGTRRHSNY